MKTANDNRAARTSRGSLLSATSLSTYSEFYEHAWISEGEAFGRDPAGDKMWALGRWWRRYVRVKGGRTRKDIIKDPNWKGPPYGTCAPAGQVYAHYENEIRIPLEWSFFKVAKSLRVAAFMLVLKAALREDWSLRDLKREVRRRRSPYQDKPRGTGIAASTEELVAQNYHANALYVDVPWMFKDGDNPHSGSNHHYPPMPLDAVKALPVRKLALDTAFLLLWVPASLLPEGIEVLHAWGFTYKTNITWCKRGKLLCGNYVRVGHEHLLIGALPGSGTFVDKKIRSWFEANRDIHSSKPEEVYSMIERAVPGGPHLELFATRSRPGWTSCGNMVAK